MSTAAVCWAAVTRYPYSEGNGIIPFVMLAMIAPLLTVFALLGGRHTEESVNVARQVRPATSELRSGRSI